MAKRPEMIPRLQQVAARVGIPWDEITIQEWRPAFCECVHEQWFHDGNPINTVDWDATPKKCTHHTAGNGRAPHDACGRESARFARCLQLAVQYLNKNDIAYTLQWTDVRVIDGLSRYLIITIPELSVSQVTQAQNFLDAQFGAGTVEVRRA